jgi:hypothetical protein
MQLLNLLCAFLSWANEFVKCSSSWLSDVIMSERSLASEVHLLDLLLDVVELG